MSQIVFIHIEKTAGSSLLKELIEENCQDHRRMSRLKSYFQNRDAECISGHFPYGMHIFSKKEIKYITMLRDPIERAVSWYYFIKDLERTDLWKPHPLREYADSVTISEFYKNKRYANRQSRFIAGYLFHKSYPIMNKSNYFRESLIEKAKMNLNRIYAFGLQERYQESVEIIMNMIGWDKHKKVPMQAKTKKRPSIEEIEDLNPRVISSLRESHQLDIELYEYARDVFDSQFA